MESSNFPQSAIPRETKSALLNAASDSADPASFASLDLSEEAVEEFLLGIGARAAKVIQGIENAEPFTVDQDPSIELAIDQFCSDLTADELKRVAEMPDKSLLVVLGFIRAARSLLFIDRLTRVAGDGRGELGFIDRMSEAADQSPDGLQALHVCQARLLHLERTRCIARVYGLGRARRIVEAIKEYSI